MFESTSKSQKRSAKGFTLIELLVVVVIVGILAAVALPNFLGQSGKARTTEASAAIDALKSGQEAFLNDNGSYASIGTLGTTTATANADDLGGNLVATGGTLSAFTASLGVNLDSAKFADGGSLASASGARWVVATSALTASDFTINVDGGGSGTTGLLRRLGASYRKTQGRVYIDGNGTV
jgi:type IV pilus assembly protein PilA